MIKFSFASNSESDLLSSAGISNIPLERFKMGQGTSTMSGGGGDGDKPPRKPKQQVREYEVSRKDVEALEREKLAREKLIAANKRAERVEAAVAEMKKEEIHPDVSGSSGAGDTMMSSALEDLEVQHLKLKMSEMYVAKVRADERQAKANVVKTAKEGNVARQNMAKDRERQLGKRK